MAKEHMNNKLCKTMQNCQERSTQNLTNTASECSKTRQNKTTRQLQSACTWHYTMFNKKGNHHTFKPNLLYTKWFSNLYHRQTQQ